MVNWDTDGNASGGDFSITKNDNDVTVSNKIYETVYMNNVAEYDMTRSGYYMDDVVEGDTFVITSLANRCGYGYTITTILNLHIIGI